MRHLRNASFHSASWVDGCLGNSVFVGIVLGYAAAAWFGALEVLIPFEAAGFAVAGLYLWYTNRRSELSTAGRTEISAAAHTVPIRTVTRKAS
jgi:hypothetical protein